MMDRFSFFLPLVIKSDIDKFQKRFVVVVVGVIFDTLVAVVVVVDKFLLESSWFLKLFYNWMIVDSNLLFENILLVRIYSYSKKNEIYQ